MPRRTVLFTTNNYYHIFSRTIDRKTPFLDMHMCTFFIEAIRFYRGTDFNISFSDWKRLNTSSKNHAAKRFDNPFNFRVDIIAFCLMPNHFHFILKQNNTNGVQDFLAGLLNSFTHAYNIIHKRKGSLFEDRFHAVPITSQEQLLVTSRYVHLNPIASKIVMTSEELCIYPWSSYPTYLNNSTYNFELAQTSTILSYFKNDAKLYRQFVESGLDRMETLSYVNKLFPSSGGS